MPLEATWLLRMKRWVQNPPSARTVAVVFGVIAVCLALYALERWVGLPDWMSATRAPGPGGRGLW